MDTILRIGFYILVLNVGFILIISLWYLTVGRRREISVNFEEFVTCFSSSGKINDPWILSGDKWIKNE
jgi:hypothetical protein